MNNQIDRRKFMRSSAAAGAGLMLANNALGQADGKKEINIALLGAGAQVAVSLVCLEGSRNAPQIALLPNVADGSKLNPGVFAQF